MRPRLHSLLTLAAVALLPGCSRLEDFGQVADFRLTERDGGTVTRDDLKGKVWVASFVFTRCAGPCAAVSANMARLHQAVKGSPDVRLVTFTVDPRHDTPPVLAAYADRYDAHPDRWLFLTGEQEEVYRLIGESFKLGVSRNDGPSVQPGYEVDHSTRLALVDARGHVRGYFDGQDPEQMPQLLDAVRSLTWPNRLPAFNALLNGTAGVLLVLGYVAVRRRRIALHKAAMVAALAVSTLFLGCYLYYHIVVKQGEPTRFQGPQGVRAVYLAVLGTHTVLAMVAAPLALVTTYLGFRDRLTRHVRLARWTLPIWLYVSVTGVVVYWMLYQLYPPA